MKTILLLVGIIIFSGVRADEGKDIFQSKCAACHTIGKGRLVGPDLKNISEKRSQDWLIAFIKSSTTMIKSGDADAVAISKEYNGLLMPDNPYSDSQILSVLEFIKQGGAGDNGQVVVAVDILSETTSANIEKGASIFSGKTRLTNGGAACSSCHSVKDERIFSSGTLAKDLTQTWEIMGSSGVAAIIKSPPFPVMNMAYSKHPITEEEMLNLTAYLKSVSKERYYQRSSDFSMLFAMLGIMFFIALFSITVVLYFNRKSRPVNDEILKRPSRVVN